MGERVEPKDVGQIYNRLYVYPNIFVGINIIGKTLRKNIFLNTLHWL